MSFNSYLHACYRPNIRFYFFGLKEGADEQKGDHADHTSNCMRSREPPIPFEGEFEEDIDMMKAMGLPLGFLSSPMDVEEV